MFHGLKREWLPTDSAERELSHQETQRIRESYIRQILGEWDDSQQMEFEKQIESLTELEQMVKRGAFK